MENKDGYMKYYFLKNKGPILKSMSYFLLTNSSIFFYFYIKYSKNIPLYLIICTLFITSFYTIYVFIKNKQ